MNIDKIKFKGYCELVIPFLKWTFLWNYNNSPLKLGESEWAGPADGGHQGDVCQEAGNDEEDEHSSGTISVSSARKLS